MSSMFDPGDLGGKSRRKEFNFCDFVDLENPKYYPGGTARIQCNLS